MKRTARDFVLLGRVWAELGAGRITEGFLPSDRHHFVEGYTDGQHITVNPAPSVVDSVIHDFASAVSIMVRTVRATNDDRAPAPDDRRRSRGVLSGIPETEANACCPKCGEDRLIDRHRTYCVCQVCSGRW